jgi:integrase
VSPSWIRRREHAPSERHPKGHVTFQVLYRRGGREAKIETLGSFDRDRDARNRRDLVAGWLALGLDPKTELAKLIAPAAPTVTFAAAGDRMISTRYDAADQTVRGFRNALRKVAQLAPELASRAPDSWTVADVQELVAAMADDGLSATTIETYLRVVKQTLDFADVDPNPARDRRVKLPARTRDEVQPPDKQEVLAILRAIAATHRLRLVVLEQTAMRIGELCSLPWGDVDVAGSRFRLSRERGRKTRHPRWVQVPEWLMPHISTSARSKIALPTARVRRQAGDDPAGDGSRVQARRRPALQPARSATPARVALARAGRDAARPDGARRLVAGRDRDRHLQPRDAARRGDPGRAGGDSRCVAVWSP